MQTVAQIDILAAGFGEDRAQLGIRERASQRDRAPGRPRTEHEQRRVETLRDDVRGDKDARADDPADDHHRRVERTEGAFEGQARIIWSLGLRARG